MKFTKDQAKFILDAVLQKPVTFTVAQVLQGVKVSEDVFVLLRDLELIINNQPNGDQPTKGSEGPAETTEAVAPQADSGTRENDAEGIQASS